MKGLKKIINASLIIVVFVFLMSSCGLKLPGDILSTKEPVVLHLGISSDPDINHVPAILAVEKMKEEGLDAEITNFAQAELAVAAMENKQIDISTGAFSTFLTAIQKGAPIVGLMTNRTNDWSVMATKDILTCEDIDGKRTAIHSEGGFSTALLKAYINENCPQIEPLYLIVPGSQDRTSALLAGEIDVTPVKNFDAMRIAQLAPGEYNRIADFASDLPDLLISGYWVRKEFLEQHPEYVTAFMRNTLEMIRQIYDDPTWFAETVPQYKEIPEEEIHHLPVHLETLMATESFPKNGGYSLEKLQKTIDFLVEVGRIEPGITVNEAFDLESLEEILREIGRID